MCLQRLLPQSERHNVLKKGSHALDLINSRIDLIILVWLAISLVGLVSSMGSLMLLVYEISKQPAALYVPEVAAMKRFNLWTEILRLLAQILALGIGVAYVLGLAQGQALGWVLVAMNFVLATNSLIEFSLTIRLLFGSRK
jgi:hypothetical protein